ncbi:MAG: hypothetical protein JNL21_09420 [Myxococcales bacterium]|nr:hypothetical protein [Myxococcales bacterium]
MKSNIAMAAVVLLACGGNTPLEPKTTTARDDHEQRRDPPDASTASVASAAPSAPAPEAATPTFKSPAVFTGTLAGKPFSARSACVKGTGTEGIALVEIFDADADLDACQLPLVVGARSFAFRIPWKTDATRDFTTCKHDPQRGAECEVHEWLGTQPKPRLQRWVNRDIHPKGSARVVKAVNGKGKTARVSITIEEGSEKLSGEIDVYSTSDFY